MSLSEFSDYVSQRIKGHQTKRYFPAYNYTFCIGQVDLWQKLNGPSLSWVSPVVVRVDETRPSPELSIVLHDWDLSSFGNLSIFGLKSPPIPNVLFICQKW